MPSFRCLIPFLGLGLACLAVDPNNTALKKWNVQTLQISGRYYVPDRSCSTADCHAQLCSEFDRSDKAHSFQQVRADRLAADFGKVFYHAPSRRYYCIHNRDGSLVFERYQKDFQGQKINTIELKVAYLHGSGTLARAFIYRAPSGELFQLPLVWYGTTGKWDMAPGYEEKDHLGLQRQVRHDCQFCHNGYSPLPLGDAYGMPTPFPEQITQGIGCQRCHGPGAEHTALGLRALEEGSTVTPEALSQSILNPENQPLERRDDACNQCHERTSKAIPALTRFGRGEFSYTIDEPLSDFMVLVNVDRRGTPLRGRIGAVSQPANTRKSRCYQESDGQLTCIVCHDSHQTIRGAARVSHYRKACLGCHAEDACSADAVKRTPPNQRDCVACHMPRRPSTLRDFPITDHWIRKPEAEEVPDPWRRPDFSIANATIDTLEGLERDLYLSAAVVQTGPTRTAVEQLGRLIQTVQPEEPDPHLILAAGWLQNREWNRVLETLKPVLARNENHLGAWELKARALFGAGEYTQALHALSPILNASPNLPIAHFLAGLCHYRLGHLHLAETHFRTTVESRPIHAHAWYYLGHVHWDQGKTEQAEVDFKHSLAADPSMDRSYGSLGDLLIEMGRPDEAKTCLTFGLLASREPGELAKRLTQNFGQRRPSQSERKEHHPSP